MSLIMLSRNERLERSRSVCIEVNELLSNGAVLTVDQVLSEVGGRLNLIPDDVASPLSTLHAQGVVMIDFVTNTVRLRSSKN